MAATASLSLKPPASFFSGGNRRKGGKRIAVFKVSRGDRFHESIVRLSASTVLFLGLSSLHVCSPASARLLPPPIVTSENEINTETVKRIMKEKLEADFEAYKAKVYSLTVPLKLVALRGSVPPSWIKIRLFDSTNYLKAFNVGDVWVTVGWSSDVIPVAKRMSNVTVIVPKSGATLWADLWAISAISGSGKEAEKIGGRVRGPSPLIHQWIEFCLQPPRSLPFTREVIPCASPSALDGTLVREPGETKKDRTKLDTNLVSGVPPLEILSKCEFLEPALWRNYRTLFRFGFEALGQSLTPR